MKDSLNILNGLCYEVRAYMNSLVGYNFLLDNPLPGKGNIDFRKNILNSGERLIKLFDKYLEYKSFSIGNSDINVTRCRLQHIPDRIVNESQINKNIALINESTGCDRTEVYLDENKVYKAIKCLVQNAINCMSEGCIKTGFHFIDNRVTYYVLDSCQDYIKIREFFYSRDTGRSLIKHFDIDAMINIIIARRIVEILGGAISVGSHRKSGTGIYLTFPVKMAVLPETCLSYTGS